MILTKDERKQVYQDWLNSETLTDEDGLIQLAETALLEKLRGGVELPEALGDGFTALVTVGDTPSLMEKKRICVCPIAVCSLESAIKYGAAQRLAGREQAIEECAAECLVLHANGNYKYDTRQDCHDAIRALAASPQEQTCTWTESDDSEMPGTYASSCGEMWSFTDGGVKENRVTYCHHCGGKVVSAPPQEQK